MHRIGTSSVDASYPQDFSFSIDREIQVEEVLNQVEKGMTKMVFQFGCVTYNEPVVGTFDTLNNTSRRHTELHDGFHIQSYPDQYPANTMKMR